MKSWDQLTALEQSACMYSDMYKDCYGVRPRFDDAGWTVEDYDRAIRGLADALDRQIADEKAREAEAAAEFERTVAGCLEFGAKSREEAIRWILNDERDIGHFEFVQGIPAGYIAKTSDIEQIFAKEAA